MEPKDLLYTTEHEWLRVEDDTGTVGISDHAQDALGDLTFIELPAVGTRFDSGDEVCAVESAKAASSIYAPVSGKIVEINSDLEQDPSVINSDPYDKGWFFKIKLDDPEELSSLMTAERYETFLGEQED